MLNLRQSGWPQKPVRSNLKYAIAIRDFSIDFFDAHTGEGDVMDFILGVVLWSLLIGVMTVLVVDSIVLVPAYHYGVLERFRKRTGTIYYEGIGFKLPFIDKVIPVSMALTPIPIEVAFTSADKLQLGITGSLQYRPDPKGVDKDGRNLFISMSEAVIKNGIEDMLRDMLGGLGGVYNSDDFIKNRQALGDLINNILQFGIPYHFRHDVNCEVHGCVHKGEPRIDAKDLIAFYNVHWKVLKEQHDREQEQKESPSSVERRYGIEVEVFALSNVDFSKEMKASLEAQKQADARAEAFGRKMEMAAKAKALGASPQEALNAADVSLTPDIAKNKVVVSVEGQAGVLGGVLGLLKK